MCCEQTCLAKHFLSQKMQIQDLTSAADSAKSIIFTAAFILHRFLILRKGNNSVHTTCVFPVFVLSALFVLFVCNFL